ncbi:MAG: hypothetical protein V4487_07365 [Chlamydiota bacterium]
MSSLVSKYNFRAEERHFVFSLSRNGRAYIPYAIIQTASYSQTKTEGDNSVSEIAHSIFVDLKKMSNVANNYSLCVDKIDYDVVLNKLVDITDIKNFPIPENSMGTEKIQQTYTLQFGSSNQKATSKGEDSSLDSKSSESKQIS